MTPALHPRASRVLSLSENITAKTAGAGFEKEMKSFTPAKE